MPLTGPFRGTEIKWHEYAEDHLSITLELRNGDRLMFNRWEDFDDWYAEQLRPVPAPALSRRA